ncbi:rhomboid peptidase family protein [Entamoeba histolytica HM-1:IMSS-B]|uniref:rhomboid protease n=5 Tax=Entamoeba histolytica TaxID=5759 RepID=C4M6J0_ENTH1|nr:peptidase S54 (rhomboid) family protein [Entamoeba histolytica HM-1:IMSS]EMH77089.1 rhomboid peptidase family protein [Entamoeba histolytica HM-1:IMSS-B]EMS14721.1 peptidase S54 (rhomboid) family protein [Entamoeba histolytica HM-3:IMSS]ENY65657.1 peptidase S54 (rhomboid) family protein, putative [Entamoeba histolytica HM-1:IMSS-A]GAT97106.1 peptidase s54 rhomboid family protein [Entamoeba histolytica]EAL47860.1 peptidase S54 (rhomboid) family protein [Entamoeba histolytica HM-1:IMSS]|eukprot:XP_653247.1 peptidase S54 (rhomboid) family protein [Entamoeba histolytica HM-1:IMSS]
MNDNKQEIPLDLESIIISPSQCYLYGIDGNVQEISNENSIKEICFYSYFPCFIQPICRIDNLKRYLYFFISVTFIITAIETIWFFISVLFEYEKNSSILIPTANSIKIVGGKNLSLIKCEYQYFRLVLPIFLQNNILQLIVTIIIQLKFGIIVERILGSSWYFIMYIVCGTMSLFGSYLFAYELPFIGCSSSLIGIMTIWVLQMIIQKEKYHPIVWVQLFVSAIFSIFVIIGSCLFTPIDNGISFIFSFGTGILFGLTYFGDNFKSCLTNLFFKWANRILPILLYFSLLTLTILAIRFVLPVSCHSTKTVS